MLHGQMNGTGSAAYTMLSQDEDDVELELREQSAPRESKGIYFSDDSEPKKRIDYVLVYETNQDDDSDDSEQSRMKTLRQEFEGSLRKAGLLMKNVELFLSKVH